MSSTATITDKDVQHLMQLVAGYARWFVGMPDAEMMNVLHQAREALREELTPKFGPATANTICEAFIPAVISARRELEANGGTSSLN
ncbi:hypothetical protein [Bradyrhizobium genosp. P]|uniref:hypothetical protein n=1 Tax=Bradyrhizobium genosp. P TaxID=83641 RepID=UPI003CF68F1A